MNQRENVDETARKPERQPLSPEEIEYRRQRQRRLAAREAQPRGEGRKFNVSQYARAHNHNAHELRAKLRAAGLGAPYALVDVERVAGGE